MRVGMHKRDAILRQGIKIRRQMPITPKESHVVGTSRVNRNQHDIGMGRARLARNKDTAENNQKAPIQPHKKGSLP